jgi:hypothetical protein
MLRVRLKYEKSGPIRFVSHRDLMRMFRRSFASAEIPVCYSQGFNPHPRFSFGPSLRTGWEGCDEYLDALLDHPCDDIPGRCARQLPAGLRILDSGTVGEGVPKLAADVTGARYEVYIAGADAYERGAVATGFSGDQVSEVASTTDPAWRSRFLEDLAGRIADRFGRAEPGQGAGDTAGVAIPRVLDARCSEASGQTDERVLLEYFSTMHGGKSLFPEDILTPFLGEPARYAVPIRVVRRNLYVERKGEYVSPMSRAALETAR